MWRQQILGAALAAAGGKELQKALDDLADQPLPER